MERHERNRGSWAEGKQNLNRNHNTSTLQSDKLMGNACVAQNPLQGKTNGVKSTIFVNKDCHNT
jgi:hypothetical protein